ncbi:hypothetical protein U2F26_22720 [Micromonospora sp. 4G57]|uniref:Uncharacterized protein n=1 Tax=Micromonospora sicca TaxID=2202420 RepID=A0ABU5JG21_9ACTN|nr:MULTISPECIES: hypothetical protein [unclassified Micromonospora]MDZ5445509.1 hypothetical protein [Micromonospora sp. 4G57]MDZ5491559.1 hypothetical protein [Micromonospora sp. 4G53]
MTHAGRGAVVFAFGQVSQALEEAAVPFAETITVAGPAVVEPVPHRIRTAR